MLKITYTIRPRPDEELTIQSNNIKQAEKAIKALLDFVCPRLEIKSD